MKMIAEKSGFKQQRKKDIHNEDGSRYIIEEGS